LPTRPLPTHTGDAGSCGPGREFNNVPAERTELDLVRRLTRTEVEEPTQRVMHLRYRVRRR
jgi:hypothetical protein